MKALFDQLKDSVRRKFGVEVRLIHYGELKTTVSTVFGSIAALSQAAQSAPRRIGDDVEDKETRLQVVIGQGSETRVLWELNFAQATGYPVSVLGPTQGDTNACFTEPDLRQAFLDASKTTIVGRKIKAVKSSQST